MDTFYEKLIDPLDDDTTILKLVDAYTKSNTGFGGFYGKLTTTTKKEHVGKYYVTDKDRFYSMLFNRWKKTIVDMRYEEFVNLYKKGELGNDFSDLRGFLKRVKDVSTFKEIEKVHSYLLSNDKLLKAYEKYRWNRLGASTGWIHVSSRYVNSKKEPFVPVEHRLYINTDPLDTYKVATVFIEKCEKMGLPYYFKFNEYGSRDDTFVIYASTKQIFGYLSILDEIKKEHPDIVSRTSEPPILTGKIDGWIGYGTEPPFSSDNKPQSFNGVRADLIEEVMDVVITKWICQNKNLIVEYQDQDISYVDYLATRYMQKILKDLKSHFEFQERRDRELANKSKNAYRVQDTIKNVGYSLEDLDSPWFCDRLHSVIRNYINKLLVILEKDPYTKNCDSLDISLRYGKKVTLSLDELKLIMRCRSNTIARNCPEVINSIRENIKNNCRKFGIDEKMSCCGVGTRDKLKVEVEKREKSTRRSESSSYSKSDLLRSQIKYFEDMGDYATAELYKEQLESWLDAEKDQNDRLDQHLKDLEEKVREAGNEMDYVLLAEYKQQLAIISSIRSLNLEERKKFIEENISTMVEIQDYKARSYWLQALSILESEKVNKL